MNLCEIKQRTAVRCDVKKTSCNSSFLIYPNNAKQFFLSKNCVNRDGERDSEWDSVTETDSERVSVTEREICVI